MYLILLFKCILFYPFICILIHFNFLKFKIILTTILLSYYFIFTLSIIYIFFFSNIYIFYFLFFIYFFFIVLFLKRIIKIIFYIIIYISMLFNLKITIIHFEIFIYILIKYYEYKKFLQYKNYFTKINVILYDVITILTDIVFFFILFYIFYA